MQQREKDKINTRVQNLSEDKRQQISTGLAQAKTKMSTQDRMQQQLQLRKDILNKGPVSTKSNKNDSDDDEVSSDD